MSKRNNSHIEHELRMLKYQFQKKIKKDYEREYAKFPQRGAEVDNIIEKFFHLTNVNEEQLKKLEKVVQDKFNQRIPENNHSNIHNQRYEKLIRDRQQQQYQQYQQQQQDTTHSRIMNNQSQSNINNTPHLPKIYGGGRYKSQNTRSQPSLLEDDYMQHQQRHKNSKQSPIKQYSSYSYKNQNDYSYNNNDHISSISESTSQRSGNNNKNGLKNKLKQIQQEKQQYQKQQQYINTQSQQPISQSQLEMMNNEETTQFTQQDYIMSDFGRDKVLWNASKSICQLQVDYSQDRNRSVDSILDIIKIAKDKHKHNNRIKAVKIYF